jgi:hypothetical protein
VVLSLSPHGHEAEARRHPAGFLLPQSKPSIGYYEAWDDDEKREQILRGN